MNQPFGVFYVFSGATCIDAGTYNEHEEDLVKQAYEGHTVYMFETKKEKR